MSGFPLLRVTSLDVPVALCDGQTITAARFLAEVAGLAAILPATSYVINLTNSRYRFTVGFAAALMRGQVSLLPPNDAPGTLAQLAEDYPDSYILADRDVSTGGLPLVPFPAGAELPGFVPVIPEFAAGQVAALLFTSGSTGRPKPQVKTWGGFVRSTLAAGARLRADEFAGATLVGTVPHQHSYGIESTVLLPLQHGLIMHDSRPLLPADVAACLEACPGKRLLVTTPVHLKALLGTPDTLPSVELVLSATAPLSPQLAREAEASFAAPLLEIYGCSEAGQLATRRTAVAEDWQCFDGITLRQDDAGTWAQGDAVGAETLLNDAIELHDPKRFRLHGRTSDLVNIAGKRSSLAHLNWHLNAIPGVEDGVFILPDNATDNMRLMAFVVAPKLSAQAILTALGRHIDPAFLPRPLTLVDRLPRNELGKLPREAAAALIKGALMQTVARG